jgi:pimeloyl-ACP methyl ester carboxylesterase
MQHSADGLVMSFERGVLTRRRLMQGLVAAALAPAVVPANGHARVPVQRAPDGKVTGRIAYDRAKQHPGIRSRFVSNINGLTIHALEAGFEGKNRPALLLLHGFPELAYSWRHVMVPLASAGYHVIAPDLRGYGLTTGWDNTYEGDGNHRTLNTVREALGLVSAFGYKSVAAVIGHDFGSPNAAWCALVRPDVFRSVVMMSAPFAGPPELPFNTVNGAPATAAPETIYEDMAKLKRPRKHYQRYYSTREANDNMWHAPQGVHAFLRGYYHMKSGDWKQNKPFPLKSWTAEEVAKMPTYYIMDLNKGMAETVAPEMPSTAEIATNKWLPDDELAVYAGEYTRNGFQGGLQWYKAGSNPRNVSEQQLFSGRTIDVPSAFISGKSDWGVYQRPGAVDRMQKSACTRMMMFELVEGAGHWVQQEKAEQVTKLVLQFLRGQNQRPSSL